MESYQYSEVLPTTPEKKELALSSTERELIWKAKIICQSLLIGRYVNAHLPAELVRAWNEGDTSVGDQLKAEKLRLEEEWSAFPRGAERFALTVRELTDRALASNGAEDDQGALRFTRAMLKLVDVPAAEETPTGYRLTLSSEEEVLLTRLQATLTQLEPADPDRQSIVH